MESKHDTESTELDQSDQLVDARVVASFLGASRAYVLKLALLGRIPAYRLPPLTGETTRTHWRFRMGEIQDWMTSYRGRR